MAKNRGDHRGKAAFFACLSVVTARWCRDWDRTRDCCRSGSCNRVLLGLLRGQATKFTFAPPNMSM